MTAIVSLCVFCGSKVGDDPAFETAARRLGNVLAERGVRLVYGGGGIGLMGVLADAVLAAGGAVSGVIPEFLVAYEVGHAGLDQLMVTPSMHERKRRMFEMADGFVVLPGGLGTLDEAFEIITWKQLRLHAKPIVILDVGGYWRSFEALIANAVEHDFAHASVADLFTVVGSVEAVFTALNDAPEPRPEVFTDHL